MTNDKPIRHVVLFSSKDPANIDAMVEGLSMLGKIPSVSHFEVTRNRNEDHYGNDVDVIVYAEFATAEDLEAYRTHQIYKDCIDIVRPLRDLRVAADF